MEPGLRSVRPGESEELSRLRTILIGEYVEQLEKISSQMQGRLTREDLARYLELNLFETLARRSEEDREKTSAWLSKSVVDSIQLAHQSTPERVSQTLAPIVSRSINAQIKAEKEKIVDALYPVMGSMVAKYTSEALRSLIERINAQVENRFSWGAGVRRIKAWIFGVSEAELLFREQIGARIQSIFLIHRKTGVLIAESHATQKRSDGDMVGAMFSAISEFVNEWIARDGQVGRLDSIEYGGMMIVFESSGSLILATVFEGPPRERDRQSIRSFLELVHTDFDSEIQAYDGVSGELNRRLTEELEKIASIPAAEQARKKNERLTKRWQIVILSLATITLVASIAHAVWLDRFEARIAKGLRNDPVFAKIPLGIESNLTGNHVSFSGALLNEAQKRRLVGWMRRNFPATAQVDVSAVAVLEAESGLSPSTLQTMDGERKKFEASTYAEIFTTVTHEGGVIFSGYSAEPIDRLVQAVAELPEIYDVSNEVRDLTSLFEIAQMPLGKVVFGETQSAQLAQIGSWMKHPEVRGVILYGLSDEVGTETAREQVARARAAQAVHELVARGISRERIRVESWTALPSVVIEKYNLVHARGVLALPTRGE